MYENKQFNVQKKKMSHLTNEELADLIYNMWKHGIPEEEKDEYFSKQRE